MYFYEVLVSSRRYHGTEPLTYSYDKPLATGTVVRVGLGGLSAMGIVFRETTKPSFATKPVQDVVNQKPLPTQLVRLHEWLASYYPAPLGLITQLFLPNSLTTKPRNNPEHSKKTTDAPITLPKLTEEQANAVRQITGESGPFLLHGETGSGKTRVYMEAIQASLQRKQSALVLTPEIGLTAQLSSSLRAAFGRRVIVIHSEQTPAERRDSWLAIHNASEPLVIVGPRSALFAPIGALGLIVVDEAHDNAYKQEQMPYYQTTRVAGRLTELHGAKLVLGSATPLVHDYYAFAAKDRPILQMVHAAAGPAQPTQIDIVDLKDRSFFTRSSWLSNQLIDGISSALSSGKQSLVFLNRRGTARLVLCQHCGWQATCPRCDLPLTYHGDSHHLRCHTCGFSDRAAATCPDCGSTDIVFKSIGTKTIVDEIQRLFPKARLQRFDSDSKKAERLEQHYDAVRTGSVDILIGTQMLAKGLDLPKLGFIGVVVADTGLYFPDYSAEEQTFQMLRQVIGRVGRGHVEGNVIIQTYHPDSPAIEAAANGTYREFYESQLKERELYHFPPYYFMLKIGVGRRSSSAAQAEAHRIAGLILEASIKVELSGPAPSFVEKARGQYHWQLVARAKQRDELLKIIKLLPKNCSYDIDPTNLL